MSKHPELLLRPRRRAAPRSEASEGPRAAFLYLLPAVFLSLGCFCVPYYELGGGVEDSSVTVPGEDGVHVKAEAAAGDTTARIVMERETRKVGGRGEVRYVIDQTRITQQLRLELNDGAEGATFEIAEHDEASSFDKHDVAVSPDGKRVAYRIGDRPWRFVHLLSDDLAVHGPGEQDELDWRAANNLADDFVPIFNAQNLRLDALYSFNKQKPMLQWLRAHRDDAAVARALFEVAPEELPSWPDWAKMLTPKGLGVLKDTLQHAVQSGSAHAMHYSKSLELDAVEIDKLPPEVLREGSRKLAAHKQTVMNDGTDLAEFLRVLANHDKAEAARIACELVGLESEHAPNGRPFAMDLGRPLQIMAFALIADHATACPAVETYADVRCTACGGSCSPAMLADAVREVAAESVPQLEPHDDTPEDPETLARVQAAAQVVSMKTKASCP